MITKENLTKLTWKSISILKQEDDTLLIVLFFNTAEEGEEFLNDYIKNHEFNFVITTNEKDEHSFVIQFAESDFDIKVVTKLTTENYTPLGWLESYKGRTFLTTGEYKGDGKLSRSIYKHPII